jgi:peptidyl-prolyl cis-trans isomerase SurA
LQTTKFWGRTGQIAGVTISAALIFALAGCRKSVAPDVAATVNGRSITFAELDRVIAAQFPNATLKVNSDQTTQLRLEALRALIDNEILLQRAEKEGLLASDSDVEAKFNEVKVGYTQEDFQKQMDQRRMSVADLKAQIRRDLSVEKLMNKEIGAHITISDADVKSFYETNKASFNLAEDTVHLARILVTPAPEANVGNLKNNKAQNDQQARSKIQMLDMRIRQGEDFATLAQNYSEDQWAQNGGDVGFVPASTLDKANQELRKLIFSMTPGQVSPVIHTPEGYTIIKLIARQTAGQRQLSDPRVQEEIRQEIFQAKQQTLRAAFYEVARSESKVVNYYALSVLDSRDKK